MKLGDQVRIVHGGKAFHNQVGEIVAILADGDSLRLRMANGQYVIIMTIQARRHHDSS
jgi:hypothetical protein